MNNTLTTPINITKKTLVDKIFNLVFYILLIFYLLAIVSFFSDAVGNLIEVGKYLSEISYAMFLANGIFLVAGIILSIIKKNWKWITKPLILTALYSAYLLIGLLLLFTQG